MDHFSVKCPVLRNHGVVLEDRDGRIVGGIERG